MNKSEIHVWLTLLLFSVLTLPLTGYAETATGDSRKPPPDVATGTLVRSTEKGLFDVTLVVEGQELKVGANRIALDLRHKGGKAAPGATIAVTPWLPERGHGVWEKPVVTESGGGKYTLDNVVFTAAGNWQLTVAVQTGAEEDKALFTFSVGGRESATEEPSVKPRKGEYVRTVEYYKIPNVTLLNQDGEAIRLRAFLDTDKPVIIDFIYTTCTTICPILSAGFTNLQRKLGKEAGAVQFVSISIDPEHDRPEQMKEYLAKFKAGDNWDFLTGSHEDITLVLKSFDALVVDKMSHRPLYLLSGPRSDDWVRVDGLVGTFDLMEELKKVRNK